MFEYIKGNITEINPTYLVLECGSIGYFVHISLHTFTELKDKKDEIKLFIHHIVREDAEILYGFFNVREREMFRLLIGVSGVGANTACIMLSSLNANEIAEAIMQNNIALLKSAKGIGVKTAQRIVIELKDKLDKNNKTEIISLSNENSGKAEAVSALVMLGFNQTSVEKTVNQIIKKEGALLSTEAIIKEALNKL